MGRRERTIEQMLAQAPEPPEGVRIVLDGEEIPLEMVCTGTERHSEYNDIGIHVWEPARWDPEWTGKVESIRVESMPALSTLRIPR